jgi:hypothetical protein
LISQEFGVGQSNVLSDTAMGGEPDEVPSRPYADLKEV